MNRHPAEVAGTGREEASALTGLEYGPREERPPGSRRTWWGRRGRGTRVAIGAAVLFLGLWAARVPILTAIGSWLTIGEPIRRADVIFPLGGEISLRPFVAADLYRQGYAPRILLVRVQDNAATRAGIMPNETDATITLLTRQGVPRDSIVVLESGPQGVGSTSDEAARLREYLRTSSDSSVIVVTSSYHTRRAKWTFDRAVEGMPVTVMVAAAEHQDFNEANWWHREVSVIRVFEEYLKFAYNWIYF